MFFRHFNKGLPRFNIYFPDFLGQSFDISLLTPQILLIKDLKKMIEL